MKIQNPKSKIQNCILVLGGLSLLGLGGPVVEKTREGNRAYQAGQFDQAQSLYVEARSGVEAKSEDAFRLHLNLGDALYQQKKYGEARKEFEQAQASETMELPAQSAYNIGNTYFKEAMQTRDQNQALELLKQAVASYWKTLELTPDDEDAKYNLEVVRRHLDVKQQQQQPQPQPQPQAGNTAEKQEQEQAQAQPQPQAGGTAGEEPKPAAGEQKKPEELSQEEAERLLDAMQAQEEEQQKERFQINAEGRPGGRDW